MELKHYILKDKKHIEVDLITWAKSFENVEDRKIAFTENTKGWRVSTVFLGIDHSFDGEKELLYETMVFNSKTHLDNDPFRYATYEEAEKGHLEVIEILKDLLKNRK